MNLYDFIKIGLDGGVFGESDPNLAATGPVDPHATPLLYIPQWKVSIAEEALGTSDNALSGSRSA